MKLNTYLELELLYLQIIGKDGLAGCKPPIAVGEGGVAALSQVPHLRDEQGLCLRRGGGDMISSSVLDKVLLNKVDRGRLRDMI